VAGDPEVRNELIEVRKRFVENLPPRRPETLGDARDRTQHLVADAYSSCGETGHRVASAIRGLNHLINCIDWALLCGAEADEGVPAIESEAQVIRSTHAWRSLVVRFSTTEDIGWISPPSPIRLNLDCPLD